MCRRNQLWACCIMTFGLGLLIGSYMESGFICSCIGIGAIAAGLFFLQKK